VKSVERFISKAIANIRIKDLTEKTPRNTTKQIKKYILRGQPSGLKKQRNEDSYWDFEDKMGRLNYHLSINHLYA